MGSLKSALLFVLQSIVVGLAVAFLVVLIRPDLLPGVGGGAPSVSSYSDAVDISAPSVANVYTTRLVQYSPSPEERPRFRIENSFGSAVVIDPEGYLVTNYHVVAQAAEISIAPGDLVITSGHGGAFPAGLPVGIVVRPDNSEALRVQPFHSTRRLEFVRLMDFGLTGVLQDRDLGPAGR